MNAALRHLRPAAAAAAAALAAAVGAGVGLAGSTGTTAAGSTYQDPAGDASGAPDITEVGVSNDAAGTVTIRVSVPGRPHLGFDDALVLWINADRNEATGYLGDEYRLLRFAFGAYLERWNGSQWDAYTPPSFVVRWETAQLVVSFNRADFGIGDAFDFGAGAVMFAGDDSDTWPSDEAPDFGYWTYTIVFSPTLGPATMKPARPTAGRLISVSAPAAAGGKPVDAGTVKCTATLAGKQLRPAARGLNGGRAGCAWRLPATATGKAFRGQISVTTAGGTATRAFSATVR